VYFTDGVYFVVAVKKELNSRIEWWKEEQAEIENEFKVVYKAQDKMPKGRKVHGSCPNHDLSSYAGKLRVEFLVKVAWCPLIHSLEHNNSYYL